MRVKYQGRPLSPLSSSYISLNMIHPGPGPSPGLLPVIKELLVDVQLREVNFGQLLKVWRLTTACCAMLLLEHFRDELAILGN